MLSANELAERARRGIPRWADVSIALLVLIIASPLIAVLAVLIALTSGMPVFFRQQRVGVGFRPFSMVKLRTMSATQIGPKVTRKDDPRITRLGRFLRQTKLDELPTFWNVLRGDIALVGPRPEVPEYVNENDPLWQAVLTVRPGLTDPVTISLRNEEELLARVESDPHTFYVNELQPAKLKGYVDYLQKRTLRSDIRVLGRTVTAIIGA